MGFEKSQQQQQVPTDTCPRTQSTTEGKLQARRTRFATGRCFGLQRATCCKQLDQTPAVIQWGKPESRAGCSSFATAWQGGNTSQQQEGLSPCQANTWEQGMDSLSVLAKHRVHLKHCKKPSATALDKKKCPAFTNRHETFPCSC